MQDETRQERQAICLETVRVFILAGIMNASAMNTMKNY